MKKNTVLTRQNHAPGLASLFPWALQGQIHGLNWWIQAANLHEVFLCGNRDQRELRYLSACYHPCFLIIVTSGYSFLQIKHVPLKTTVELQSKCIAVNLEISVGQIMEGPAIPSTMFAWRKYKGNYEPVGHSERPLVHLVFHRFLTLTSYTRFMKKSLYRLRQRRGS